MPFDAKAAFGAARAPVRCTLNGVDYRSRLAAYGETRERRVGKALTMLREGVTHP